MEQAIALSMYINVFFFFVQLLMERRRKSEENDLDPLVWTNERVAKWCRSVDLGVGKLGQEYALMNESDPRSNVHYLGSSENKA